MVGFNFIVISFASFNLNQFYRRIRVVACSVLTDALDSFFFKISLTGFFFIRRGVNECKIESAIVAGHAPSQQDNVQPQSFGLSLD